MAKSNHWNRDELLAAFRMYCQTPFGKLHYRNPEIIELSALLGRTPSAIAMKAVNFASLDPVQQARNIAGLRNASRADRELWEEFKQDSENIAAEVEAAYERLLRQKVKVKEKEREAPKGSTETQRLVKVRRVQGFFRATVLASYEFRCALTDLAIPELLNASHIIPWSTNINRRADPRNGIALNALYDRAFDRGLITFDESFKLVLSSRLRKGKLPKFQNDFFLDLEGSRLRLPARFSPDPLALTYHRENIFIP
jgi:predicted restriction endonuclease